MMLEFIIVKLAVEGKAHCFATGTVECTTTCAGSKCWFLKEGEVLCPAGESGD